MLTAYIYLQALFNYFTGCRNCKQHAGSLRVFTSTGYRYNLERLMFASSSGLVHLGVRGGGGGGGDYRSKEKIEILHASIFSHTFYIISVQKFQ